MFPIFLTPLLLGDRGARGALDGSWDHRCACIVSRVLVEVAVTEDSEGVDVPVEEDQDERVEGGIGPCDEREKLVELGRLLKSWIADGQQVERVPTGDEERGDEAEDTDAAQRISNDAGD